MFLLCIIEAIIRMLFDHFVTKQCIVFIFITDPANHFCIYTLYREYFFLMSLCDTCWVVCQEGLSVLYFLSIITFLLFHCLGLNTSGTNNSFFSVHSIQGNKASLVGTTVNLCSGDGDLRCSDSAVVTRFKSFVSAS